MGYRGCKSTYSAHENALGSPRMPFLHGSHDVDSAHLKDDKKEGEDPDAPAKNMVFANEGIEEECPDNNADDGARDEDFYAPMIEIPPVVEEGEYVGKNQQRQKEGSSIGNTDCQ